jgi:hypothetical protein
MDELQRDLRSNRSRVSMDAILTLANGGMREVVVEDLSIDGACVCGYFRPGETVSIRLPRIGSFEAAVCWARGGKAGLKFARAQR